MDGDHRRVMVRRFADILRAKAIVLLLVMAVMQWGYVLIRVQTIAAANSAMQDINADLTEIATEHKLTQEGFDQRLDRLESYVFGTIQKAVDEKKRPITAAETWQRNRDQQISKRLSALEDWRQRTEDR